VGSKQNTEENCDPLQKARFQKKSHKFGIELPTSINHAHELDRVNEYNLWMEALQKETFNI
jgi:hypothetical protein